VFELNYAHGFSVFGDKQALLIVDIIDEYSRRNIDSILERVKYHHGDLPQLAFICGLDGNWIQVHLNEQGDFLRFSAPDPQYFKYFNQGLS